MSVCPISTLPSACISSELTQALRDVQSRLKFAFIEGPDRIALELIEDHTQHPLEES